MCIKRACTMLFMKQPDRNISECIVAFISLLHKKGNHFFATALHFLKRSKKSLIYDVHKEVGWRVTKFGQCCTQLWLLGRVYFSNIANVHMYKKQTFVINLQLISQLIHNRDTRYDSLSSKPARVSFRLSLCFIIFIRILNLVCISKEKIS